MRFVADGFDLEFLHRVSSTPPGHVVKVVEVVHRLIVETLQSRTPKKSSFEKIFLLQITMVFKKKNLLFKAFKKYVRLFILYIAVQISSTKTVKPAKKL